MGIVNSGWVGEEMEMEEVEVVDGWWVWSKVDVGDGSVNGVAWKRR